MKFENNVESVKKERVTLICTSRVVRGKTGRHYRKWSQTLTEIVYPLKGINGIQDR